MKLHEAMARIKELDVILDDLDCLMGSALSSELERALKALKAKYKAEQEALRNAEVRHEETAE